MNPVDGWLVLPAMCAPMTGLIRYDAVGIIASISASSRRDALMQYSHERVEMDGLLLPDSQVEVGVEERRLISAWLVSRG